MDQKCHANKVGGFIFTLVDSIVLYIEHNIMTSNSMIYVVDKYMNIL